MILRGNDMDSKQDAYNETLKKMFDSMTEEERVDYRNSHIQAFFNGVSKKSPFEEIPLSKSHIEEERNWVDRLLERTLCKWFGHKKKYHILEICGRCNKFVAGLSFDMPNLYEKQKE
jgi:hypothetical protein